MARRNKSASRQMVESLKDQLTEYFRENVFDDYDYEDLTGSELFEALVETFKELENDLKEELKPIQYVLNRLEPEDSQHIDVWMIGGIAPFFMGVWWSGLSLGASTSSSLVRIQVRLLFFIHLTNEYS